MATSNVGEPKNLRQQQSVSITDDLSKETPAKRVKLAPVTPSQSSISDAQLSPDDIHSLLLQEADYDCRASNSTLKRSNYLSWDDYFMAVALLSSQRSKDPHKPTGACIVNSQQRIIGIGYNGFPRGCSDDLLPWVAAENSFLKSPNPYMVHAEVNAILNKCSDSVAGARLYVPHFPCNECAKVLVQSRIKEVVYMVDDHHDSESSKAARILFAMAGVKLRHYQPAVSSVDLDLASFVDDETNGTKEESPTPQQQTITPELQELLRDVSPKIPTKRRNYLSWDDYFMGIAFLTAQRSKDPNTQVGACIVNSQKRLVGLGYNGFPQGCCDDALPWARHAAVSGGKLHTKYPYVCHAEVNAVLNKCSANVQGATIYVALFPCNECAKVIIQAGIREVVYTSDKYHDTDSCRASRILFQMAGVALRQYIPTVQHIHVDFQQD